MQVKTHDLVIIVLILAGATVPALAQPADIHHPIVYQLPRATSFPPTDSLMPGDVLYGYHLWDSAARHTDIVAFRYGVRSMTTSRSDTVRTVLKYWYAMVDHSPIRFQQWLGAGYNVDTNYKAEVASMHASLLEQLPALSPDSTTARLYGLMAADYIFKVRVTNVQVSTDSAAKWARTAVAVTSTITDVIKGHRIPACLGGGSLLGVTDTQPLLPEAVADSGDCIKWAFRAEWPRADSTFTTSLVRADSSYVVFLNYDAITADSVMGYEGLSPLPIGTRAGIYPIVNGSVIDPDDDLAFGPNTAAVTFIAKLRTAIDDIVSFVPPLIKRKEKKLAID